MHRLVVACCVISACAAPEELASHEAALVNGTALCRNQLPAVVPWLTADPAGGYRGDGLICSATLIAPRVALTASHCVYGAENDGIVAEGTLIGVDMTNAVERDGTTVVVQQASTLSNDVALLLLATPVDDRPLIPLGRHWAPVEQAQGLVVGYGATKPPGIVRGARGPKKFYEATLVSILEPNLIFHSEDGSVSHGDSGGPTLVQDNDRVYVVSVHTSEHEEGLRDSMAITPYALAEIEDAFEAWGLALPAEAVGDDIARFEPCDHASDRSGGCAATGRASSDTFGVLCTLTLLLGLRRRKPDISRAC